MDRRKNRQPEARTGPKALHAADDSADDPSGRYILLKLARDAATQATNGLLAFEAIDKMAEQFLVDDVDLKMNVLTTFTKRAKSPADHKGIGEQAAGLVDGAIAHDNLDMAVKLCELAVPKPGPRAIRICFAKSTCASNNAKSWARPSMKCRRPPPFSTRSRTTPRPISRSANTTVSRKAIGKRACPCWPSAKTKALKAVAGLEISGITKADDQLKVGDAWWDLAEKEHGRLQATLRGRANYWYQQALPELSGMAKARLEKRIKDYEASSEGSGEKKTDSAAGTKKGAKYLPGLVAQYYNDPTFIQPAHARVDAKLDFDWTNMSPDTNVNAQNFSVRWLGYLKVPKTGRYIIHARGHNDCQVMIDKTLVIANPVTSHRASDQQATISLTAGYHLLGAQFVHGWGQANIHIGWQPPGETTWVVIPAQNLFHDKQQEQVAGIVGR